MKRTITAIFLFLAFIFTLQAQAYNVVKLNPAYVPNPIKGVPISLGKIYVGVADADPTVVANQIALYVQEEDGTITAVSQPVTLGAGGVPLYNGSPVSLLVDGNYSLAVLSSTGAQVYYIPSDQDVVKSYPSGISLDDAYACDLADAVAGIGAVDITTLKVDCDPIIAEGTTVTVTSNITLDIENGSVPDGVAGGGTETLAVNGGLIAAPSQRWIGTNVTVDLSGAKIEAVWPDWWTKNVTQDTTDMSAAINSAITAYNTVNFINDKIYRHDSKINLKSSLTLNIGSAMLKFYGASGWAMENPDKETAAINYVTINSNWDGYFQCAASGADGYLDLRGIQKSAINFPRVVGYTQTKGNREGIALRFNRGPSAAVPGWWNTVNTPYIVGLATGIEVSNYANRSTIINPHIEACDDYGIYNPTDGGDSLTITGGEVSINGDNAAGANIYSDEKSLVVVGTTIEDNSGSGKGVQLGANADGFFVIAKVAASADAFDIDPGAIGTWQNLSRQGELNVVRPRFTPQAADFAAPVDGLLMNADGTVRGKGMWRHNGTEFVPMESKIVKTVEIDLSGAATTIPIYWSHEDSGSLYQLDLTYPEATSADAAITLEIGKANDDGTTDRDYYHTFATVVSSNQWQTARTEYVNMTHTAILPGDVVTVYSPGGKVGVGTVVVQLTVLVAGE